ncbi:hypothetical protein QVD17_03377 [Tagetes erecta]|uniref:F-box domain-containing protein n=1 Tax=Tagetes erecta TaxID=13708 RepID=A0AAD8P8L6_TARER|nr:hypothetical protein QVD17_03377 [Tagetes erecta]
MDHLPDSLLLEILSRLNDSADVARCRVASKAFDTLFPDLRSINLRYSLKWYLNSDDSNPRYIKPKRSVFLDLISNLRIVESVSIGDVEPVLQIPHGVDPESDDLYLTDGDFAAEWLPRVSDTLKSLSIFDLHYPSQCDSNILELISLYCHSLRNLTLASAWLFVDDLSPMPMLTSLTLTLTRLEDEKLDVLNEYFPNLQVLNLEGVTGLKDPTIRLLNLKTCHCYVHNDLSSLTLITPNLITLRIKCTVPTTLHVEAPVLSHFDLRLFDFVYAGAFTVKKFENLKTLWLKSSYVGYLLSLFPITKTLETLTLDTGIGVMQDNDSKVTLAKVFTVFPNLSYLRINQSAWFELEGCSSPEDWELLDGGKGLKAFCAYFSLVDPLSTFSYLASVLDQCVGLVEVSLLIYYASVGTVSKSFMSRCMARWPLLKWRWGVWREGLEDSWITDGLCS